mgnify:FL=1
MTFSEIAAKIDRACGTTATSYTLANKATDVNLAFRDLVVIALKNRKLNYDDNNHIANPFITLNLEDGYRDYYLDKDEQSNIILAINKLMVVDQSGVFHEMDRVNMENDDNTAGFWDGQDIEGQPTRYSQVGMAIFLDPVPNYDATGGIKAYIDREPDFFTSSDTTKVAGIDPLCQDYLWLKPCYEYCRDHDKKNAERLFRDMNLALQRAEARLLGDKTKDLPRRIIPVFSNNR